MTIMNNVILLKMGELVLKGLNRSRFERELLHTAELRVKPFGNFDVRASQSTCYIEPMDESADINGAFEACSRIFGITALCLAVAAEKDMAAISEIAAKLPGLTSASTFKVEARRADKGFPLKSPEICADVGEHILSNCPWLTVDVHKPQETVWVEIRERAAYVHLSPTPGAGGLPNGTSGKALLMLSGGIDSPVAGWRMARRGLALSLVHFYSYPYTSPESKEKVFSLARVLARYTGALDMYVVPFTQIQEATRQHCPEDYFTLVMRRSMCRITEVIAKNARCGAIITGESLGQVASQTMEALACTEDAVSLPIFRPLLGMDKEEVVTEARRIGTFDISSLPFEDCCTVFTPRHPKTKPKLDSVINAESAVDWQVLESTAVHETELVKIFPY